MSNHHLLIIFPWILDAFQWRGPSSKCAACGTVADVLHSHEFNFLQATNYLWLNVTRRRADSFMQSLHLDKLLSWWTGGVAAGVCTTKTECSRGYDSCCNKCCLIIPEWTETWWRPQNFSTDCNAEAKEVRQSVVVARAKTEDVATAQQHWHIHHFSGPVAIGEPRTKDQGSRPAGDSSCCSNAAATSCHMSRRCRGGTGPKDKRTTGRHKECETGPTQSSFCHFFKAFRKFYDTDGGL